MTNEKLINEYEKAAQAYEDKFDEPVPLMFLRGLDLKRSIAAINKRVEDEKTFADYFNEQDWLS